MIERERTHALGRGDGLGEKHAVLVVALREPHEELAVCGIVCGHLAEARHSDSRFLEFSLVQLHLNRVPESGSTRGIEPERCEIERLPLPVKGRGPGG